MCCIPVYDEGVDTIDWTPDEIAVQFKLVPEPVVYRLDSGYVMLDEDTGPFNLPRYRIPTQLNRFSETDVLTIVRQLGILS